ncbi:MAG: AAA family ATPase [Deltaproteobacteria bacterium]|nr:AAA family ATPase [Deltaproteobacteria bacterium]
MVISLRAEALRKRVDPELFAFETTAELPPLDRPIGQARALRALEFGLGMESRGYNLFVVGPPGAGRQSTTMAVLAQTAACRPPPPDLVYLFDFDNPDRPIAVSLPAGTGELLRTGMQAVIQAILTEIPKALSGEAYEKEKAFLLKGAQERKGAVLKQLEGTSNAHGYLVQRSAEGLTLVLTRGGAPVSQEEFERLPPEEQQSHRGSRELLQEKLRGTIHAIKDIERETRAELKELERRITTSAIGHELDALRQSYQDQPRVLEHLDAVERDVVANLEEFRSEPPRLALPGLAPPVLGKEQRTLRYQVNVLVNNKDAVCAPVVFESNPTCQNLVGRVEHRVQYGALVTDFTLVKAGALHRANGGYLVLEARDLLLNPLAYDALKRVLKDREIKIEEPGEAFRLISTAGLRPEPFPAEVKVILLGTPWIYYVLQQHDDDFAKLFKVKAELSEDVELDDQTRLEYAYLAAKVCASEGLLPLHRDAVAKLVEEGLRNAEHQRRIVTHSMDLGDLVREAHIWAKQEGAEVVRAPHVVKAVQEKICRNNELEEYIGRLIAEGTVLIDTEGSAVGQANGLSVFDLGDYAFGKPCRVTAKVFLGKEGVINVEREAEMGGRIHNKGVLILQGFFGSRYAQRFPISFAATLCFEQSYGGVEGDSASSAELFALVSALAEVPIRQDIAVTGSVNQMGQIQSVGGINLKIEGFYKTCKLKGLSGTQGVIIPASNVQNLMLDDEVVEAVERGSFHIYAISRIDEGLEILTGLPAGEENGYGEYPEGTINGKVMRKVERLTRQWKKLHQED